ncbi:MAG: tetratricopeptide repeat protein, partial [Desulfobacula sp.]|nr:tetratricopeptide repeat protein [Desulfobacula sp.]
IADIYFATMEFDSGLKYLKTAVSLDKKYAVYWYNMGKNLQSQRDYDGAILAYEQYFIALPEKNIALKEIGDCHTKLGNHEAAQEAYQQFEKLN